MRLDAAESGSSPLTRGKRLCDLLEALGIGLIPAHAGKTSSPASPASRPRAHPRSRGENVKAKLSLSERVGSSPLTRGKRGAGGQRRDRQGLIPAHAGKTATTPMKSVRAGAHPRSRGENRRTASLILPPWGSSPLTRGKLQGHGLRQVTCRLIPAHAGKTLGENTYNAIKAAHPRSRGENRIW